MQTAEAEALEFASKRAGDRLAERGFPDSGRAYEAQNGSFRFRIALQNTEVLKDALLDFFEAEVIFVQYLAGMRNFEVIFRDGVPRQIENKLEISAGDVIVGRASG